MMNTDRFLTRVNNENILKRAYSIIEKQSELNMRHLPVREVVALAYLMGLDHGYAANNWRQADE